MSACNIEWLAYATVVAGVLAVGAAVVIGKWHARIVARQSLLAQLTLRSVGIDLAAKLRILDEAEIADALAGTNVSLPIQDAAGLVEAIQCILDKLGVPEIGGDDFNDD